MLIDLAAVGVLLINDRQIEKVLGASSIATTGPENLSTASIVMIAGLGRAGPNDIKAGLINRIGHPSLKSLFRPLQ